MQILIDIPRDVYEEIMVHNRELRESGKSAYYLEGLIQNGIPLPKGHGDLIDRDDLLADSYCIDIWSGNEVNIVDVMTVKMADTIIPADKAESKE